MAQRIKVVGYIYADDVEPQYLDPTHEMGVSNEGYETGLGGMKISSLEDVEYSVEED